MKRWSLLPSVTVLMSVTALIMTACQASPPAFEVTLRLSPTPALIGPTRLLIDVTDAEGDAVAGVLVSIEGLADERTDRATTIGIATDEGAGRYVVPAFDFYVGGSWTLAVTVTDSTGASIRRAFPISVFGGP